MSSLGINFSGLASGLDSNAIIDALLSVEQRPILQLESQRTDFNRQKSLFGDLETRLNDLFDALDDIDSSTSFVDYQSAVDTEDYLTASAGRSANPGTYNIGVRSLARGQTNQSNGVADAAATAYQGDLNITIDGETHFVGISSGAEVSLNDVANAINNADIGVDANVVDTGIGSDPYKLVLTSEDTGEDASFTLEADGANAALTSLVGDLTGNQVNAENARIEFQGVTVERSSNTVDDLITGVTLTLKDTDATLDTTLTISADATATGDKVQEFVDKYNAVVDFIQAQGVVSEDGEASSALFGDSTLRSISTGLRSLIGSEVNTGNSAYSLLSQIGIDTDRDGKLQFNRSEFEEALADDGDAVRNLFTQEDTGVSALLSSRIESYTDSVDGLLKARRDGIDTRIRQTDRRIEDSERRIEQKEIQLRQQYANLESLMAQLQSQGSAFSAATS